MQRCCIAFAALIVVGGFLADSPSSAAERTILTRLFFQDDEAKTVRWADLYAGSPPSLGPVQDVPGFPKVGAESQTLVQMEAARGMLLVGVRDDDDGKKQSGWVLIDAGVASEEHDGHSHSVYHEPPRVRAMCLDDKQGNPAHLYVYQQVFYLANDKREGYTRLDPARIAPRDDAAAVLAAAKFIPGGGGHITLAAFQNEVGYSSWIDRTGENAGRVDVTPFASGKIAYSFQLPSGGIHGATANGGKVFFAPVDGVCWVDGDAAAAQKPADVKVRHLSLGKDPETEKPVRTGAFSTLGKHVLFVTGSGPSAALQWLDASAAEPTPHALPLNLAEGARPVGSAASLLIGNYPMAVVFQEPQDGPEGEHQVSLIELDPNLDGDFRDARVGKVLPTGKSKVDGHAGHHAVVFLPDQRHAVFSNPGDGTLSVIRPRRLEAVTDLKVGGTPSKIEAVGGPSGH